ncbi:MAG: HxsD-like protein [Candidatus Woesearchaeota archaeon]
MIAVKLNKELYYENVIKQAIKDYKKICDATIKDEGKYYNILLQNKKKIRGVNEEIIKYEFCNYCLGLMKKL